MIDTLTDADKRELAEACGWSYLDADPQCWDGERHRFPWSGVDDAIAALEAWRSKDKLRTWIVCSPDTEGHEQWEVSTYHVDYTGSRSALADTLPLAACRAILASV